MKLQRSSLSLSSLFHLKKDNNLCDHSQSNPVQSTAPFPSLSIFMPWRERWSSEWCDMRKGRYGNGDISHTSLFPPSLPPFLNSSTSLQKQITQKTEPRETENRNWLRLQRSLLKVASGNDWTSREIIEKAFYLFENGKEFSLSGVELGRYFIFPFIYSIASHQPFTDHHHDEDDGS